MHGQAKSSGFTIVELLIVIVVIAILAVVGIVAYNGIQNRAADTAVQSDIRNIVMKVNEYYAIEGSYPSAPGNEITAFNISVSKSSYETPRNNLYYCAHIDGNDARFGVAARSVSGNVFAYYDGGFQPYSGSFSASGDICPNMGISTAADNFNFSNGHRNLNGGTWRNWTN